jgi:hypothetical protein
MEHETRLVIELDGEQHYSAEMVEKGMETGEG